MKGGIQQCCTWSEEDSHITSTNHLRKNRTPPGATKNSHHWHKEPYSSSPSCLIQTQWELAAEGLGQTDHFPPPLQTVSTTTQEEQDLTF